MWRAWDTDVNYVFVIDHVAIRDSDRHNEHIRRRAGSCWCAAFAHSSFSSWFTFNHCATATDPHPCSLSHFYLLPSDRTCVVSTKVRLLVRSGLVTWTSIEKVSPLIRMWSSGERGHNFREPDNKIYFYSILQSNVFHDFIVVLVVILYSLDRDDELKIGQ